MHKVDRRKALPMRVILAREGPVTSKGVSRHLWFNPFGLRGSGTAVEIVDGAPLRYIRRHRTNRAGHRRLQPALWAPVELI